ncbi:glycosyltransferase family 4 protein [Jatrophihabitans sp. YIM 134969]
MLPRRDRKREVGPPTEVVLISDDPAGRGGIASVARGIVEDLSPLPVVVRPSYRLGAPRGVRVRLFAASVAFLVGQARRRRSTSVVHLHLSQRGSFLREGALVALGTRLGYRVVVTLHGSGSREFLQAHPRLTRAVLRRADRVYCLGPARAADVRAITGVPADVLSNYVPVPTPAEETARSPRQVVFVGEVSERKGIDVLSRAWDDIRRRVPEASLVVVGTDGGAAGLLSGRPGVTLAGQFTPAEVERIVGSSALLVLPSRAEGQPMAVLEAMAAGTPVVATDVGEVAWTVGDGGLVVAPGDAGALADAVVRLLAYDGERATRGRRAADIVAARFSTPVGRSRYAVVYGTAGSDTAARP